MLLLNHGIIFPRIVTIPLEYECKYYQAIDLSGRTLHESLGLDPLLCDTASLCSQQGHQRAFHMKDPLILSKKRRVVIPVVGFTSSSYRYGRSRLNNRPGSHRDWTTCETKMVMEKSWNLNIWQKVMEFCDQSWKSTSFTPEFYQICAFFCQLQEIYHQLFGCLKSAFFYLFHKMSQIQNLNKQMAMENQETVMDKSWKSVGTLKYIQTTT